MSVTTAGTPNAEGVWKLRLRYGMWMKLKERAMRMEGQALANENDAIRRCVHWEGEYAFYRWFDSPMIQALPRETRLEMMERRAERIEHMRSVANGQDDGEKVHEKEETG